MRDGVFPGAALAWGLGGREGRASVGQRRLVPEPAPLGAATWFDLASLTKPIATVTLAMRMVERGALDLDAPAARWAPGLDGRIRVRDLLAHASGLPAWRPLHERARDRAHLVELAATEPLEREPGAASVYSDLGFIVLGAVLERVGGERLDALFAPVARALGWSGGYAPLPTADVAATEVPLEGVVHDENARAMGGVAPHAGLFAPLEDVAAYCRAVLAGLPGVSPATQARFLAPAGVPGSTWCLGLDRPSPAGYSSAGGRMSRQAVGHLGFTGCSLWIDPARELYVVLLSNRVHPTRANDRIRAFRPVFHDAVLAALGC